MGFPHIPLPGIDLSDLLQDDRLTASLVFLVERRQGLPVIGQRFQKMVLDVVNFTDLEQFIPLQHPGGNNKLGADIIVERPGRIGADRQKSEESAGGNLGHSVILELLLIEIPHRSFPRRTRPNFRRIHPGLSPNIRPS